MTKTAATQPETKPVTCPVCAVEYHAHTVRLRHGRETTCSRKCSYELRAAMKRRGRVKIRCATCDLELERTVGNAKSKHGADYCSRQCHYAGRRAGITPRVVERRYVVTSAGRAARKEASKRTVATRKARDNYRHTDATRSRLAEATAQNIASGRIARVSKIEHVVAEELTRRGVRFERQHGIRNPVTGRYAACVDFYIPDAAAVIEVNGTFWHADPRVYPERSRLAPAQVRTVERYAAKVDLLRKAGLQLVEIWEADLRESVQDAVGVAVGALAR